MTNIKLIIIQISLFIVILFSMFGLTLLSPTTAQGKNHNETSTEKVTGCKPNQRILGIPTWYKYLESERVQGKCRPIIDKPNNLLPIGIALLEIGLTLAGLVAVVMIFIGGFRFVLSQGEPEQAAKAKSTVINTLIGLVIVIASTSVVSFIANRFIE